MKYLGQLFTLVVAADMVVFCRMLLVMLLCGTFSSIPTLGPVFDVLRELGSSLLSVTEE